ncbi:hypothetical protein Q8A73_003518 [Channa argus]|nr:hypothetical protein Q8A73_003518 [Channa argus]
MMSECGIIEKEDRKSVVDIYVSAESLRVYDNPWVEGMPPNVQGAVEAQHPVPLICENPRKRKHIRTYLVFLGVVCLVLFVAIICLGVQVNKERNQDICGKGGAGGRGVTSPKEEDQPAACCWSTSSWGHGERLASPDGTSVGRSTHCNPDHGRRGPLPITPVKLPRYSGLTPLEPYLAQVELAALHGGWSGEETATHLALALEGPALQVLADLLPEDRRELQAITATLQRHFGQRTSVEQSREQLAGRYRHDGESLGAFAADVQLYTQRGYPTFPVAAREELSLHSFLRGLAPERLRQHVRLSTPRSLEEARREAERAEEVSGAGSAPGRSPSWHRPVRAASREAAGECLEGEVTSRAQPAVTRRRLSDDRCHRCGEPGHFTRDCLAASPRPRAESLTGNGYGMRQALVDTGSTICLLRWGVLPGTAGPLPADWTPTIPLRSGRSAVGESQRRRGSRTARASAPEQPHRDHRSPAQAGQEGQRRYRGSCTTRASAPQQPHGDHRSPAQAGQERQRRRRGSRTTRASTPEPAHRDHRSPAQAGQEGHQRHRGSCTARASVPQQPPPRAYAPPSDETAAAVAELAKRSGGHLEAAQRQQLNRLLQDFVDIFAARDEDCTRTGLDSAKLPCDDRTLDLRSGYWQVELAPEARSKTAFTIGQGLWQFKVMPFGLCNAPATFERLMERVLKDIPRSRCVVYLDDLLVHAKGFEDAINNLAGVFMAIRQAGLRLNPAKCHLLARETQFLGHVVNEHGVTTDRARQPEGQLARWLEILQSMTLISSTGQGDSMAMLMPSHDAPVFWTSAATVAAMRNESWGHQQLQSPPGRESRSAENSCSSIRRWIRCWLRFGAGWRLNNDRNGRPFQPEGQRSSCFTHSGAAWSSVTVSSTSGGGHHVGGLTACNSWSPVLFGRRYSGGSMDLPGLATLETPRRCAVCDSVSTGQAAVRMRSFTSTAYLVGAPMERVGVDILGPFPTTEAGNRYILVAMDYFTKWPEAYAVPDQTSTTAAQRPVEDMVSRFGVPEELHSDQGRNFESWLFAGVCQRLRVRKTRTTPLHPQSDGLVERFNRTLTTQLAILTSRHQKDWDQHLPLVPWAYRTAVQESSQCTPATLMFGRELRTPVDLVFGPPPEPEITGGPELDYLRRLKERLSVVHQLARESQGDAGARQKRAYDGRCHGHPFSVGDNVWVYCPVRKWGLSPKLTSHWQGPGEILDRISEVVYRVRMSGRGRRVVLHRDRLAPYHPLASESSDRTGGKSFVGHSQCQHEQWWSGPLQRPARA